MKTVFFLFLSVAFSSMVIAQKEAEVKVNLRNGSVINGKVKVTTVEMTSAYGKLTIPYADVTSIELGIMPDKSNKSKIDFQLKQLMNENETTRQNAYEELMKLKPGEIYVVEDFLSSESYTPLEEGSFTADELVEDLKMKYGITDLNPSDMIVFGSGYSIGGTSNFQTIALITEFGTLNIPREKIQSMDVLFVPSDGKDAQKSFVLQASKHISGNTAGGWVNTGITVRKGQKIQINAKGSVILASLSNGKYTPDGPEGTAANLYNYEGAYPQYGMVVYKIGESGTATPAGSKFSGTVKQGGTLYISIYETVYNASNTGTYNVTVKTF